MADVTIDNERREFRRTVAQLQDTFPNVFLSVDVENLVVRIFGGDDDARRAEEVASQALRDGPANVERLAVVTCSQSQIPRMMRGLNEPAGEQPKIIGNDERSVLLRCLPGDPHTHDWGGIYEPLNPRVYS